MANIELFIDSGAHTFYMAGKGKTKQGNYSAKKFEEYFTAYIKWLKQNTELISGYVNLDVINDPVVSMENWQRMVKEGLDPVAVIHPGEDPIWATRYIEQGATYLGLGGLGQFFTKKPYIAWADRVWKDHLCDKDGMSLVKVHGFAMTSTELLFRYPWYSVDSSTWIMCSRRGIIILPSRRYGKYVFDIPPTRIEVSASSPHLEVDSAHLNTLSTIEYNRVIGYIHERGFKVGKSEFTEDEEILVEEGLCNNYHHRDYFNFLFFNDLEQNIPKWPWPLKFNENHDLFGG